MRNNAKRILLVPNSLWHFLTIINGERLIMKLPIQAQPVVRKVSTTKIIGGGIFSSQDCETECYKKTQPCMVREGDCGFSECLKNCKKIKYP